MCSSTWSSTGAENGTIRLYIDSEDVVKDLEDACREVVQEDPLGAYAVEYIKHSVDSIVTYSEAQVQIIYLPYQRTGGLIRFGHRGCRHPWRTGEESGVLRSRICASP